MSAPEAWVPCPTCGGDGIEYAWPDDAAADTHPCPDCADGLVPSDGEIEAAAQGLYEQRESWITLKRDPWDVAVKRIRETYLTEARAALVAARRYQRKAGEQ